MMLGKRFLVLGIVDQALASIATLSLSVAVLRASGEEDSYAFSVGLVVFGLCVSLSRSLGAEPAAVFAVDTSKSIASHVKSHVLVGFLVGLGGTALMGIMGALASPMGWLISAALITATCNDAVRSTYVALGHAGPAVARSLIASICISAASLLAVLLGDSRLAILGWLLVTTVIAVIAMLARDAPLALRDLRPEAYSYTAEFMVTSGASQASLLIAIAVVGQSLAVGQRALVTAFGPYLAAFQALAIVAVPFLVRSPRFRNNAGKGIVRGALLYTATLLSGLGVWAVVIWVASPAIGFELLGPSWSDAEALLPAYITSLLTGAVAAGVFIAGRATGDKRLSLSIRIVSGVLMLIIPVLLALYLGASGFFWGSALASLVVSIFGYMRFLNRKDVGDERIE